jgi:uncharacterized membrane protein YcaP (DUF421 family)
LGCQYQSITEGLILVTTIAFWDYFLDGLGYRFPFFDRLLRPSPLLLVKNGHIHTHNLSKEMITDEELQGQLREKGIDKIENVKESYLEGDGRISIIRNDAMNKQTGTPKKVLS